MKRRTPPSPSVSLPAPPYSQEALDSKSSLMLMETFHKLNTEMDSTILMVTHDAFSASYCDRIFFLKDGEIRTNLNRDGKSKQDFFADILDVMAKTAEEGSYVP